MNNIEALIDHILARPQAFGIAERNLTSSEIAIEVRLPRFEMRTGRILYLVHFKRERQPRLIAQSAPLWAFQQSPNNPYRPDFNGAEESLKDVLPIPSGAFDNGPRRVYWARFVKGTKIAELLRTRIGIGVLGRVAERLSREPWLGSIKSLKESDSCFAEFVRMTESVSEVLLEVRKIKSYLVDLMRERWEKIGFCFSHGDVWCNDIIYSDSGEIQILDWEWASDSRPVNIDLMDLALSAIEVWYNFKQGESLSCLLRGTGLLEKAARGWLKANFCFLGYDRYAVQVTLIWYLVYAQYRILLQTLYAMPPEFLNCGRSLSVVVNESEVLKEIAELC